MKKKFWIADRIIRYEFALSIVGLYFVNIIPGNLALGLLFIIGYFFITGVIGFFNCIFRLE